MSEDIIMIPSVLIAVSVAFVVIALFWPSKVNSGVEGQEEKRQTSMFYSAILESGKNVSRDLIHKYAFVFDKPKRVAAFIGGLLVVGMLYSMTVDYFAIRNAKEGILAALKDPYSAHFKKLHIVGDSVCGYVNSRNGFGAYTGFQPFGIRIGKSEYYSIGDNYTVRKQCGL